MVRHLHDQQVALGNPRDQVGPAGNPEIGTAGLNDRIIMGKQAHQPFRTAFTGSKKQQGYDPAPTQHNMENVPDRFPVSLAPILGTKDGSGGDNGKDEHVLHKLDLGGKGNRRHLVLGHTAQHQGIRRGHRRQHKALEGDRRRQCPQFPVKGTVVDLHGYLRAV